MAFDKEKKADELAKKFRERVAMTQDDVEHLAYKIHWLLIEHESSIKSEILKKSK